MNMNYFSFEYPWIILLLIPIIYCLYKCKEYPRSIYFVHLHLLSPKKSLKHLEWLIKVLIFIFLIVALASPILIDKTNPLNRHGKDILLAIDASGSMNSSGFNSSDDEELNGKSRFEITKHIAKEFIKNRRSDNVGIVLFGDFAFIASPITYEKDIVIDMFDMLSQGMAGQNTAVGEAISIGVRAFKHSRAKAKVIILLSDGEHNSGSISPKDAVKFAKSKNIKIYTIAIGKKGEADEALLSRIAVSSGGHFYYASNSKELKDVYENIDELESSKIKSREYLLKNYYYEIFLLLSVALLLYLMYREVKR
jgi:Ca-activated chloride channel family protein